LKQEKETVQSALTNRNRRMGGHGIAGIGDGRITADGRHTPAAIAMDGDNGLFRLGVDQRSLLAVGFKVCVAIAVTASLMGSTQMD
jgi:hypothetical protein